MLIKSVNAKMRRGPAALAVCLALAVAASLLVSACSGNSGNSGDGDGDGDGNGGNKRTSQGAVSGGAQAEDAKTDQKNGNGDDNKTDGDNEEEDDVFATMPAADYSPEIREQLDDFQDLAAQLPLDDVYSANELRKAYLDLALEGPVNDALFFEYEQNIQAIVEGINDVFQEGPPDEETIEEALENGFLFIECDDYSSYFILRPDFLDDTFSLTVSTKVRAFLNLQSRHYQYRADHDFIESDTLMVTLDQLAEMIVDWENYIRVYQDAANYDDIVENLDYYLKIYIGSIQIENSGMYTLAGKDENGETLYKLMDEARQSYLKFIENYQDSAACPLIAELYQIYKDNDFLYSIKVEDFFRAYGLAYDV